MTTNTAENTANNQAATPATPAAPDAANNMVTVNDLVTIVKFLEEMANMRRLSQYEMDALRPSFERIVAFLTAHEQQMQAAQAAAATQVAEKEEKLLDLPKTKGGKKKGGKKK